MTERRGKANDQPNPASASEPRTSRRTLVGAGAGLALTGTLPAGVATGATSPTGDPKPNAISPADAVKRLREGNARYAANEPNEKDFSTGRAARATAQYPFAAILSCADSRVAPELVFDQGPGELFVVRVAGNFVDTELLASLEYGVEFLGIPLIVVLGHTGCGAVYAAIQVMKKDAKLPGHLPNLIRALKPAVVVGEKATSGTLLDNAIVENVRRQVAALKRANPIVAREYAAKNIDIIGGVYDLATGRVTPV